MGRRCVLIALLTALPYFSASATIRNVPGQYSSIQSAINACATGDTVLAAMGVYNEVINFFGKSITVGSQYLTTGDSSYILSTIIIGDIYNPTVSFTSGEDSTTAIIGFTIKGVFSSDYFDASGIYCHNSSPIIAHNIIRDHIGLYGGGIHLLNSHPLIMNNLILNNRGSYWGGGIYSERSWATIKGNIIRGNHGVEGAGMNCWGSTPSVISDNVFEYDSAYFGGGAIFIGYHEDPENHSEAIFYNNILRNNYANSGGAMVFCHGGRGYFANNIIYDNHATYYGGVISCYPEILNFTNCIFWGNTTDSTSQVDPDINYTFCDIEGGQLGLGNINSDPLFRNPESGDFHLMSTACGDPANSPCIDAGNLWMSDSTLNCLWGLGESRSDMGAYGGGIISQVGVDDPSGELPQSLSLSQNYPNPFNPNTAISYNVPKTSHVSLEIYDILGRKVETLVNREEQAGPHQAIWNAQDAASGLYFYRLQAGEYSETRKMLLLR
ncbi:MAG TPA: hypothetical protein DEO84_07010 [candidate division Zixibacteria bacterium]|jgi:putative cofactor-binding repeat protein|nr:hypothetical protein [candidate division Zixibacteria bacterium]HBZ01053.1 hypothetical protein [candidate division Zixibacteria bacterium]